MPSSCLFATVSDMYRQIYLVAIAWQIRLILQLAHDINQKHEDK